MIEIEGWLAPVAGVLATAVGAVNLGGLLQARLLQRARMQVERERTKRSAMRSAGLVRMVQQAQGDVRIVEEDFDGKLLFEIGRSGRTEGEAA